MLQVEGRTPSLAVCLVGEPRSIALTAPTLRDHLLTRWRADAFVVATHGGGGKAGDEAEAAASSVRMLGARVVRSLVNRTEWLLDPELFAKVSEPKLYERYVVHVALPDDHWPQKIAAQLLTRLACHDAVREHERRHGFRYEVYARLRLDTALLGPVPRALIGHGAGGIDSRLRGAAGRGGSWAVVPRGEDYGEGEGSALNDRMLCGDSAAFTADARVWESVLRRGNASEPWTLETLTRQHMSASRVAIRRVLLPHCILSRSGGCRRAHPLTLIARLRAPLHPTAHP